MNRIIAAVIWLLLLAVRPALAVVDPRLNPNNRFGIHILNPEDVPAAAALVNSRGDWGYVTVVLRFNDFNREKWQAMFDDLRRRHLIPIVRLATVPENQHWAKPRPEDSSQAVEFLNSLNWVVKNRYVILFNEPNHAKEWGNEINPAEYAVLAREYAAKLKSASVDFFILPAGLDTAAPNSTETMAAAEFWRQMYLADRKIFTVFDGWNSHSYPNPGFSGPVSGSGFGSIRSYLTEVNYLAGFGLAANLPVFITETGWSAAAGNLADLFIKAFTGVWQQPNLVAVTPFVLDYPDAPFQQFSWIGTEHYRAVAQLPKVIGQPEQIHDSRIAGDDIPPEAVEASNYRFQVELTNTGQSIWDRQNFFLRLTSNAAEGSWLTGYLPETAPGDKAKVELALKTPAAGGQIEFKLQLETGGRVFGEQLEKTIAVVVPPTVTVRARPGYKIPGADDRYRLLVYSADNRLLDEHTVIIRGGTGSPVKLYNLVPGADYRLVLLKPGYLPRQTWIALAEKENEVRFKTLLPIDFNRDGKLSLADFWAFWLQPLNYLRFGLQAGN